MTILPDQFRRLAAEAEKTGACIGVGQAGGSTLTINTGESIFRIDSYGNNTTSN